MWLHYISAVAAESQRKAGKFSNLHNEIDFTTRKIPQIMHEMRFELHSATTLEKKGCHSPLAAKRSPNPPKKKKEKLKKKNRCTPALFKNLPSSLRNFHPQRWPSVDDFRVPALKANWAAERRNWKQRTATATRLRRAGDQRWELSFFQKLIKKRVIFEMTFSFDCKRLCVRITWKLKNITCTLEIHAVI